jgi:hypothetical protein
MKLINWIHQHQPLLQVQLLHLESTNFGRDDLLKEINKRQTQNLVSREVVI